MSESPAERTSEERDAAPVRGALFDVLVGGDRRPRAAYTAIREIESMAGQSVVTELRADYRASVQELRVESQASVQELRNEFQELRNEIRQDFLELRDEFRGAVQELRTEIATTNARLDSVQRQLTLIWTILILLLGTLLGTLTTVLLRG